MSEPLRFGDDPDDPTAIFARLREVEIPAELLAAVSDGVAVALDGEAPRRPWLRPAAAWAAAAALAAAVLVPGWREPRPLPPVAAVALPAAEPARAGISSLRTPGAAQVLDLTVGDTQVVMIFDAELSL
ncbi:MAG TPA: hypothetical protein VFV75_16260 [Candidatus Polarisedimenticolaceae bacterium]|nr:hypothetical protein [Candidatus Polarisedimenticolaceae bacterium]